MKILDFSKPIINHRGDDIEGSSVGELMAEFMLLGKGGSNPIRIVEYAREIQKEKKVQMDSDFAKELRAFVEDDRSLLTNLQRAQILQVFDAAKDKS